MTELGKAERAEQGREKFDALMNKMNDVKQKWDEEADSDEEDETGHLLNQAIELALEQGRGWTPGEKEAYLDKLLDDEFVSRRLVTFFVVGIFVLKNVYFILLDARSPPCSQIQPTKLRRVDSQRLLPL